ncbi:hypothetical protein WA026_019940 [Henosepilachna vigintioctopunctata]|uniref:Envelope protein n=1 Tax=Henosepilachna vigintioctopunctata TaxID=420089 RepID=A0AAW1V3Z3_9CUCU
MECCIMFLVLFKIITFSKSLEIIQIQNRILPISLGKAYVSSKHIHLIYHIDLNKIQVIILKYQREIDNYKSSKLNFAQTANYQYLRHSNEININTLEEILNENLRIKRGLINLGGKISKALFGTLDSDDELLYKNYFNTIKNNEAKLMKNQKQIATIVNDLKNKFNNKFQEMSVNLKLLQIVPQLREVQQMHLLLFQLKDIKNVLDEIQTAVSFARLHLLHGSILPYSKFLQFIKNNDNITVYHLKDYYQLCHTKVMFRNKILLFLISIPLVQRKYYDLYRFYYLPQNNLTVPYTNPYLLSQNGILIWSTKQCHPIEDDYLCDQDSLIETPKCMKDILKNHLENCPRIETHMSSNLQLLEDGNILSVENKRITETCHEQTKYYFVPPMAILRTKCTISNLNKEIIPTDIVDEEKYIILPKWSTRHEDIKNEEKEEFKKAEIPDIELEELDQWNPHKNNFSLFLYFVIVMFIIISMYFILKYYKGANCLKSYRKATPEGDTFNQNGEELDNPNLIFL